MSSARSKANELWNPYKTSSGGKNYMSVITPQSKKKKQKMAPSKSLHQLMHIDGGDQYQPVQSKKHKTLGKNPSAVLIHTESSTGDQLVNLSEPRSSFTNSVQQNQLSSKRRKSEKRKQAAFKI